jgi:hypothetical protein
MKSILILRIAFISLFLAGLSLSGSEGKLCAQASLSDNVLYSEPAGPFVSPAVASQRIDDAIAPLKVQMEYLNPGSAEYKEANAKYTYMVAVQNYFLNGKTIPQAIPLGLRDISGPDAYGLSRNTLLTYKQELINLLKA